MKNQDAEKNTAHLISIAGDKGHSSVYIHIYPRITPSYTACSCYVSCEFHLSRWAWSPLQAGSTQFFFKPLPSLCLSGSNIPPTYHVGYLERKDLRCQCPKRLSAPTPEPPAAQPPPRGRWGALSCLPQARRIDHHEFPWHSDPRGTLGDSLQAHFSQLYFPHSSQKHGMWNWMNLGLNICSEAK